MAIGRGTYTWPFEFHLPQDLPPSSSPNSIAYPHIKYYVRMVVDRPWYKPNMWKTCPLTIFPQSTISQQINELQQPLFFGEQNRKQLRLEGYLYTSSIVPGQSLSFQFTLYNPERTTIKKIKASFVQCRQANHDSRQDVIIFTDLPGLNEFNDTNLQRNFEIPVSSDYLTPTHTFTTLYQNYSYSFALRYELKLEVRPHGAFTKFEIKLPVIVRTRPMDIDPISMTNNSPPSYKEAMNN
ncbi:hypothetical protein I4U23_015169 [Adineta vaga]|nr:hypothetical protein I4U23_015169 [Adineta vaga]